jgi:hypothetical protein
MKYLVINTIDFSIQTDTSNDEEGSFSRVKEYDCVTSASFEALKPGDVIVISSGEVFRYTEQLNERIKNQQLEIESLNNQILDLHKNENNGNN